MRKLGLLLDLVAVGAFVGIGREAHAHGLSLTGMASTAWPFVAGLGAGWLVLAMVRREGASPVDGLVVTLGTVTLGMALRVASGQGTAVAFVLVSLGFLGATMIGWRLVAARLGRR